MLDGVEPARSSRAHRMEVGAEVAGRARMMRRPTGSRCASKRRTTRRLDVIPRPAPHHHAARLLLATPSATWRTRDDRRRPMMATVPNADARVSNIVDRLKNGRRDHVAHLTFTPNCGASSHRGAASGSIVLAPDHIGGGIDIVWSSGLSHR